jgi:hypothetical protein
MKADSPPQPGEATDRGGEERKTVRTFTASRQDLAMLQAIARYHGFSKSGTITSLIRREFWRIFPAGTEAIRPDRGARVMRREHED